MESALGWHTLGDEAMPNGFYITMGH